MIKNLLFDFGGVLLDLDYEKTYLKLEEILGVNFNDWIKESSIMDVFIDFECGKVSKENLIWNIQRQAKKKTPQAVEVIRAWNAMLIGWNTNKFQVLESLSDKYKLFLLSNTNEVHIEWVYRDLKRIARFEQFHMLFEDRLFYSYEMGFRKPNKEIFHKLINNTNIIPEETIFIEDSEENLIEAKKLGFNVILHKRNAGIEYLLEDDFMFN